MTFYKGDQTMLGRVPQKRGLGNSWHFSILSSSKRRGQLQLESNLKNAMIFEFYLRDVLC
jgi:hypothetical protein